MSRRRVSGEKISSVISLIVLLSCSVYFFGTTVWDGRPLFTESVDSTMIQTVIIQPGDTLWSVAAAAVVANEDIRNKIIEIRNLNQLSANQSIQPGQLIQIPIKKIARDDRLAKQN